MTAVAMAVGLGVVIFFAVAIAVGQLLGVRWWDW